VFLSFRSWSKKRSPYEILEIEFGEDQIFTGTVSVIRTQISPFPIIFDRKTGMPVWDFVGRFSGTTFLHTLSPLLEGDG
jgi:hypothetical protein